MLCVRDKFLQRLYCKIAIVLVQLSSVILSSSLLQLASAPLVCFLLHRVCNIRCAMLGVTRRIPRTWCHWCSLLRRDLHFHNFRISVCFCSALPDAQICSTCNTA